MGRLESGLAGWKTKNLILATDVATEIRNSVSAPDLADTVASILIDQSGSMRGQKMLYAAASADIVQEFLRTIGIKVELLGFTTRGWRGGESRRIWNEDGRPNNPGRLNDLLHIIYRQADDRVRAALVMPSSRCCDRTCQKRMSTAKRSNGQSGGGNALNLGKYCLSCPMGHRWTTRRFWQMAHAISMTTSCRLFNKLRQLVTLSFCRLA
ncbi:hypothetical protein AJ88_06715 [Mesorhizobium amorphae CCBAU 01583]|nr:hypothetical protein AJ88_06715 [Mesorhizobium amorphae CCBAU 01583]